MSGIGSVLIFVIFAAIAIVSKKAKEESQNPPPIRQPIVKDLKESVIKLGEAIQEANDSSDAADAARMRDYSVAEPAVRKTAVRGSSEKIRTLSSAGLHDDLKNDWMAKQLREEARIKSSTDLGALHDVNCEAREIKAQHAALHRAGRIDL